MQIPTMTFVIAVVMIGLGSVQSTADVIIEVKPLTPQVMVAPSCKVEIYCRVLAGIAWHCFTKCTTTLPNGDTVITACQTSGGGPIVLPDGGPWLDAPGWNVLIPLENCPTCP